MAINVKYYSQNTQDYIELELLSEILSDFYFQKKTSGVSSIRSTDM